MLSDRDIARELKDRRLVIDPPPRAPQCQPVSIDLTLGETYRSFFGHFCAKVAISDVPDGLTVEEAIGPDGLELYPGEFVLATTAERVELPDDIVGRLDGKSTNGRLGLQVHSTAGLIDPGFRGQLTLEVSNVGPLLLVLRPGDRIGQLTLEYTNTRVLRPYGAVGLGSHYQDQTGPVEASTRGGR